MISNAPSPIIIVFPTAGNGWIRGARNVKLPAKKSKLPRPPMQPIPMFDRRELRERVNRLLEQNKFQREQLRAVAWS
jgi:hypothetical protein